MASPTSAPIDGSARPLGTKGMSEAELQKKRARDRKAQQAMRDRNKWQLQAQTQQINYLTQALEFETAQNGRLSAKIQSLESENENLRVQMAALRLRLLGTSEDGDVEPAPEPEPSSTPLWQIQPRTKEPECTSDRVLHAFMVQARDYLKQGNDSQTSSSFQQDLQAFSMTRHFDLRPLVNPDYQEADEASALLAQAVQSFPEVTCLAKQVALHFLQSKMLRWRIVQDEQSYDALPEWLRPTAVQRSLPHAPWIDLVPWPRARDYLIEHPRISSEALALVLETDSDIKWDYDPASLVTRTDMAEPVHINAMFEDHIRDLKSWTIGARLRTKYSNLAHIIDKSHDG